ALNERAGAVVPDVLPASNREAAGAAEAVKASSAGLIGQDQSATGGTRADADVAGALRHRPIGAAFQAEIDGAGEGEAASGHVDRAVVPDPSAADGTAGVERERAAGVQAQNADCR